MPKKSEENKTFRLSELHYSDRNGNKIDITHDLVNFLLPNNSFIFDKTIIRGNKKSFELLEKEVHKCQHLSPISVDSKKLEKLRKFGTSKGILVYIRGFHDEETVLKITKKQKKISFEIKDFNVFSEILESLSLKDGFIYFKVISKNEKNVVITLSLVLERILLDNLFQFCDFSHKRETYEEMEQYFQQNICKCSIDGKKYYLFSYDQLKYADDLEEFFRLISQLKTLQKEIDESFNYEFDTEFIPEVYSTELLTMNKKVDLSSKNFVEYFGEDAPYRHVDF